MSKIAIVNVGMHGHVNPTLGFTEELIKRGHEVIYFTDLSFKPQVERLGAKVYTYASNIGQQASGFALLKRTGQSVFASGPSMEERRVAELELTLEPLLMAFKEHRPDVVVYSFIALAARLAAHKLGIPAVMFFTTYASNAHFDLMAHSFAKLQPTLAPSAKAELTGRLAAMLKRHEVEDVRLDQMNTLSEDKNLVFMPQSFQPAGNTFGESFSFVGPCLRSTHEAVAPLLPPGDAPLVLIALGTVFNAWPEFYHDCIAAFSHEPLRVVMAIGPHTAPESLGPLPSNIRVAQHVPQLALLEQADLFVSHGGMNSTMEALYFGVPLVVIPQMEEQELTAERVAQLELGLYLRREQVTADSLKEAVQTLAASTSIRANVATMRREMQADGGTARAASIIEAAVATKQPRRPLAQAGEVRR